MFKLVCWTASIDVACWFPGCWLLLFTTTHAYTVHPSTLTSRSCWISLHSPNHSSKHPTPGIPARQPPLISTLHPSRMAQSSPAVSPQDLAAGYAALAAAYAQAAAEEEAEGEVPNRFGGRWWWFGMMEYFFGEGKNMAQKKMAKSAPSMAPSVDGCSQFSVTDCSKWYI